MQFHGTRLLFSASDLVGFNDCAHLTWLDRRALDEPALRNKRCTDDDHAQLIQRKGHEFEARYLARLEAQHPGLIRIDRAERDPERLAAITLAAMQAGAPIIYQATLLHEDLIGHADFLRRVETPSRLGGWSYEVIDTKLARSAKSKFVLQLCFYSELLALAQGAEPQSMHVVMGTGDEISYRCADYSRYFRRLLKRFRTAVGSGSADAPYPDPCERCSMCHWREHCEERREQDDSLWLLANIRASQIQKLHNAGIRTLTQLAQWPPSKAVARLAAETLSNLRGQAALQFAGRGADKPLVELLAPEDGAPRGFARLPRPDHGDVYFDMEGDPLFENGLEYLFGVLYRDGETFRFKAFWAHDRAAERTAFEDFMDWLAARIGQYPALHVYHYASYEDSALKRVSAWHGTREDALDQLLRDKRLVDLYRVVREAVRVSTPSYSIKHIERLYREARSGDVQTAGASIVHYERWLETHDQKLLDDIEQYNQDDCRSLQELHVWLLDRSPGSVRQTDAEGGDQAQARTPTKAMSPRIQAYPVELERVRTSLTSRLPSDTIQWTAAEHGRALIADLLDFQRRTEKPQWWELFSRQDMTAEELIETPDAIAGLVRVAGTSDTYEFPPQEIKLEADDKVVWLDRDRGYPTLTVTSIDETQRRVRLHGSRKTGLLPQTLNIGAGGPIPAQVLKDAVLRVATSIANGEGRYSALERLLEKALPRLAGRAPGQLVVSDPAAPLAQIIEAVAALDQSHLFIQGPPGAGKTFTASHVIVELLRHRKRVAVSSNSHKAINNLLTAVDKLLVDQKLPILAAKKSTEDDPDTHLNARQIVDVFEGPAALSTMHQLVGGTAWLFSSNDADQKFDYLFVDEAGQVSLGHLIAMGSCARNLVLLGDQMQLGQPIQGVHPGRSGESSLEYLLDGLATVPAERGIFLPTTWRMCPDVCRFISDAVYDGRLLPESLNGRQRLVLRSSHHPSRRQSGIVFLPMDHHGCSQKSEEEAQALSAVYDDLLRHEWIDREDQRRPVTPADILVVAPYNLQVNLLRRALPSPARVGTVDKFQGQEAAVVLVSMTTSSEEDLPRQIDFLFSKNRLNVAISRARCLSIVLASPRLLDVRCRTVEQVSLVNTLCWVEEIGRVRPCDANSAQE